MKEGKPRMLGGGRPGKERTAGMGGDLGKKGSLGYRERWPGKEGKTLIKREGMGKNARKQNQTMQNRAVVQQGKKVICPIKGQKWKKTNDRDNRWRR